jgi:SpoIID/LytB domain protein
MPGAIETMAMAESGTLLNAPDVYMEKIAIGPGYPKDLVDLDISPAENIMRLAKAKGVKPAEITALILDRTRHADMIEAVRKTGAFDLYPDTRSQVYRGIDAEKPSANAAVDATAGQIVTYNGKVATTYFFSTSGGRTAAIQDAWPSSSPVPYLVSVVDPYDTISPYHDWGPFPFTAATLASKLHVPGKVVDVQTILNSSGRTASIVVKGTLGDVTVNASTARDVLGLRSSWVTAGVLSLTPPAAPVVYGASVQLAGIARGVGKPAVQQKAGSLPWQAAGPVTPATDGTFTFATRPVATTQYRLVAGAVAGAPVTAQVSPIVRLLVAHDTTVLRGTVRPVLAGASVDVQRLTGTSTWTAVASGSVDSTGAFQALFPVTPGTYRAYVPAGHGLAAGASPVLKVVAA